MVCLCPDGATPQSPGLPLRLPWEPKAGEFSTATRLRHSQKATKQTQPLCGWESFSFAFPGVGEAPTPGFETQPRWGKQKSTESSILMPSQRERGTRRVCKRLFSLSLDSLQASLVRKRQTEVRRTLRVLPRLS